MKFINFTVIRISLAFAAGVGFAYAVSPSLFVLLKSLGLCFSLLLITWAWERKKLRPGIFFGIKTYLLFFLLGACNYQLARPHSISNHYSHYVTEKTSEELVLKITTVLKPNRYESRYFAEVVQLNSQNTQGKVLLSLARDSVNPLFQIDDLLFIYAKVTPISPTLNPHQFDYKQYLAHQGVHRQLRIAQDEILKHVQGKRTLRGYSESIRNHIVSKLERSPIQPSQRAIIQALVLGQRKDIAPELRQAYASAGALHILAVSGLHVGILYLLFSFLLKPLEYFSFGKQLQAALILICLWSYAIFTGLSPSVVRAVTMFSFFAFGGLLNRPTNSINTLFLSFFFLLIVRPNWLFHVGFQLSYLAVFFILWIQPKLYLLYKPKYYLDKVLWSITTVTIAAQLGIAPLSIYYFHQFPGLFFLTNLVVLPFLTFLLGFGLVVVILGAFNMLPDGIALAYDRIILALNQFIAWVSGQDIFLLEDISFSILQTMGSYLWIVSIVIFWQRPKANTLLTALSCGMMFLGSIVFENKKNTREELILFHRSRTSVIGYQYGRNLTLYTSDSLDISDQYPIKDYRIGNRIRNSGSHSLPHLFTFHSNTILRLDSLGVYPFIEDPVVILSYSPKVHLDRLIDSLKPRLIIADGSNYRSYVMRWKETCKKRKLPFHYTGEKGAYIFN